MTNFTTKKILSVAAVIIVMLTVAFNLEWVFSLFVDILDVLSPIIIGFCLAFIFNLLLKQYEMRVFKFIKPDSKRKWAIKRTLGIVATLATVALALALVLLVIIPQVAKTAAAVAAGFPAFYDRATLFVRDTLSNFGMTPKRISEIILGGEQAFDKISTFVKDDLNGVIKSVVSVGGSIVNGAADTFFGLFIAIYFLAAKERVTSQCKRLIKAVFKNKIYTHLSHIGYIANNSFSSFVGGQFIEAVILGILCFVGMLIFGFPFAPVIAVLIAVTALIPIVGAWLGGAVSAILILTQSPVKALWFLVFFIILQQLENNLIYPKVVGKQVGLPGVWVIIAVALGTGIFGPAGALLSVPLCSILYALCVEFVKKSEKNDVADS